MKRSEQLGLIFLALCLVLSGALIGAAAVSVHHVDGPALIDDGAVDDGAVDFSEDQPANP